MDLQSETKPRSWTQVLSSVGVCFAFVLVGTTIGYPTAALPQFENELDPDLQLDDTTKAWFAPVLNICVFIVMIPGGIINDKIGRRGIILLATPFTIAGWALIGFAQKSAMLFAGRIITCAFTFITMSAPGVYISEISHPSIRSSLLVMLPVFMSLGLMLVWVLGYLCSWRYVAFGCIPPCVVLYLAVLMVPETPYWLIEKNRPYDAKDSLKFFRGLQYDISREFNEMLKKHQSKPESKSISYVLQRLTSRAFLKPYMCIGVIEALFNVCGFEVTLIYMVDLLKDTGSSIDPSLGPVIMGVSRIIISGFMPLIIGKIMPKKLFFISQIIHAISVGGLGIFTYLNASHIPNFSYVSWMPMIFMLLIALMRSVGSLPVLQTLVNEMYPTDIRTHCIAINSSVGFLVSTMNLALYPLLKNTLGVCGIFVIYTAISTFMAFWGLIFIPDNRGKSLVEVEEEFD